MKIEKSVILIVAAWVFVLQYQTYMVHSVAWDVALKIGSLLVMAICVGRLWLKWEHFKVIVLYVLLFGASVFASLVLLDKTGLVQAAKYGLSFLVLPALLVGLGRFDKVKPLLLKAPIWIAVVICIPTLLLFTLVKLNLIGDPEYIYLEKYSNMSQRSFGWLGYANALQSVEGGSRLLRSQAWFLEPSNLASFLFLPIFLSAGLFLETRRAFYFVAFILCLGTLVTTFSFAGAVSLLGAIFVLVSVYRTRASNFGMITRIFLAGVACVFAAVLVLQAAHRLHRTTGASRTIVEKVLARDPSQSLIRTASGLETTAEIFLEHPFGVGLGSTAGSSAFTSPNAFFFWLVAGGAPALIVLVLLYGTLVWDYVLPLLGSSRPIHKMVAGAFVATTVHGLSYGTWVNTIYLMNVAMLVLVANEVISDPSKSSVSQAHMLISE